MIEALVQCYIPGLISILPAIPIELGKNGYAKNIRCRGASTVSIKWQNGCVIDVSFLCNP
jgi:hypothetical protein